MDRVNRFAQKLDDFLDSHQQQLFPEYRSKVIELYEELVSLLSGEATLTMDDQESSMKITITAKAFVSSKDFPALQDLIHAATVFDAWIKNDQTVFSLFFAFWKWVPKEPAN